MNMKALIGGMMMLASVNVTEAAAEEFTTITCLTSSNETFTIFVQVNDAAIKWSTGTYPVTITMEGSKFYVLQEGTYGTFGFVYDIKVGVGTAMTKYKDGSLVNNTVRCTID